MQFRDLSRQYNILKEAIDESIIKVMNQADFIMGREVEELEEKLSHYVSQKYCITCGNGTDALKLALMAWNIGLKDAVFIPDFTFFATGEVVSELRATPVFVDVNLDTFNLSPKNLETAIKSVYSGGKLKPRAIIVVDLFGLPADYIEIRRIADRYHLLILEDGAQGFGGAIKINNRWKRACSFGDISTTSFFPVKPLGCFGDGGAIFTNNEEWDIMMKSLRLHGRGTSKYDNIRLGMNSRLDTMQAAILLAKFKAFVKYELKDINYAAFEYTKRLVDIVKVPIIPKNYFSSWAQYTIRLKDSSQREKLIKDLQSNRIPTRIYYTKPMHLQKAFKNKGLCTEECHNSCILSETVLSLPLDPYIDMIDINTVTNTIIDSIVHNEGVL